MARPATGEVHVREGKGGRTFWVRFSAYGKRRAVTFGKAADGWTEAKAREELENILADVRRGRWQPHQVEAPAPREIPTFHEFASDWFNGLEDEGLRPNTLLDYEWQLSRHLLPFFSGHYLSEITVAEVDRYRKAKVREGKLSYSSINKTITRLGQILERAVEDELIDRNAAKVGGKRRKLREPAPARTMLGQAEHIEALVEAARELDSEARADRRATPRATLWNVLLFSGLRIGEALALRWRDVDLTAINPSLTIRESKTDAGIRTVYLLPIVREELAIHKASTQHREPSDLVFPTSTGKQQSRSNVRSRFLARTVERANEKLAERGSAALPHLTPHSMRRTYISLALTLGDEVPYVMQQVGHTDPKMTLSVYAQVMHRGDGEKERLRRLVDGVELASTGINPADFDFEGEATAENQEGNPQSQAGSGDGRGWVRTSDPSRVKREDKP